MTAGEGVNIMGAEATALLAELHKDCFRESPERAWSAKEFGELFAMPGTSACLLSEGGSPKAFVLFRRVNDEAEILTLAVHPAFRRKGLGQRILVYVLDHLRGQGVQDLYLEVRQGNEAARRLYLKMGFEVRGNRKGYYALEGGEREDACVMHCRL